MNQPNPDVQQAASTLRELRRTHTWQQGDPPICAAHWEAATVLADAYVAEHREDDGELLDAAWSNRMSDYDSDLRRVQKLFDFLQGRIPDGYRIDPAHAPNLTPDQAWTAIWYIQNMYWQVPDTVERCDVCGDLYHTSTDGACLDFGESPFHFCGACEMGPEYDAKLTVKGGA